MSCLNPIAAGTLADYWIGALSKIEEDATEEHLFACDECGGRLREVISLADAIRNLAHHGSLLMVVSDAFLERVAEQGLHVREYAPANGGSIACTVTAEDDFLIGRLTANLRGAAQIDLSFCDERGIEKLRLADIPFNSESSGVAFQQSITYAKAAPSETLIARLIAFDQTGGESLLGEFIFNHTRTLPGPGSW
jgi:hypothetical protein